MERAVELFDSLKSNRPTGKTNEKTPPSLLVSLVEAIVKSINMKRALETSNVRIIDISKSGCTAGGNTG